MLSEQMTSLRNSGIKQQHHLSSQLRIKVYNFFTNTTPDIQGWDNLYKICKIMLIQKTQ
jgi:hypothetical protein